ncbi:hypothetical protein EYF80_031242 [Liparis tanakae]|uniref:Uncharacterized protein n=1 Tax=Liparis tanakae TaxID=230148 RepID=A0A4Z2GZ40_9TELE|nr:hypothetical protein EYF80_031242 [Liparis tanakae]
MEEQEYYTYRESDYTTVEDKRERKVELAGLRGVRAGKHQWRTHHNAAQQSSSRPALQESHLQGSEQVFNVYFSVVNSWLSSHIWLFRLVSAQLIEQLIDARCRQRAWQRAWQPQRAVQPRHGNSTTVAPDILRSCQPVQQMQLLSTNYNLTMQVRKQIVV